METLDVNNIRSLTEFRNKMQEYIIELNEIRKPILLNQHKKSAAVLLPAEKYQEMQDKIEFMCKVAQRPEDYKNDRVHSVEQTFRDLDNIIKDVKKNVRIYKYYSIA